MEKEMVKKNNGKYMVTKELVKEIIQQAHLNSGHNGAKKTFFED